MTAENGHIETQVPARWRWLSLALVILILLAYPLARLTGLIRPDGGPANLSKLLGASMQFYQARRYSDAIAASLEVLKLDPNSADAYNNLAISYAAMNQWEMAIHSAQEAIRISPNYILAKNNLASILQQQQAAMNPVSGKSPSPTRSKAPVTPAAAMLAASTQLYEARRYQEAINVAKEVLKKEPASVDAYNNLAISYAALGQWQDALDNAQTALRIDPNDQLAKNNLAWIAQQHPTGESPESYLEQSRRDYQAGNFEASLAAAKNAAKLRWNYAEAYNNMAVALIGLKRYDEAIDAANMAVALKPGFALAENNLNWARQEKKKAP